jgi:uncharacterized protein (DUF1330 family)
LLCGCIVAWLPSQSARGEPKGLAPNAQQLTTLEANPDDHPVFLLKLVKFQGDDGRAAYRQYLRASVARLRELGGDVIFYGEAMRFPLDSTGTKELFGFRPSPWDAMVLERYRARKDIRKMKASENYREAENRGRESIAETVVYALNGLLPNGKRSRAETATVTDLPKSDTAVFMLNLMKFKPDGGEQAYRKKYASVVVPMIKNRGGQIVYALKAEQLLVGEEQYDRVPLVMYPSKEVFQEMILSEEYQAVSHHRSNSLKTGHLYGFSNEFKQLSE